MKKIISMIMSLVCVSGLAIGFSGCDTETDALSETTVRFLDFEEYAPDFQLWVMEKSFGKISLNTDMNYVKSGKASAKIQPLGKYTTQDVAKAYYPFESELFEYNYRDIRKIEAISMAVYNAGNTVKTFKLGLALTASGASVRPFAKQNFRLEPGWNDVVYYPDHNGLNIAYDITDVNGFSIEFENANSRYLADAPVYYFDDVKLYTYEEPLEIENVLEYDEGEIVGFEKAFHSSVFSLECGDESIMPEAEIIEASTVGLTATQGKKVLKLTLHPGEDWSGDAWPSLRIAEKVMSESGYKDIPEDERRGYRIAFDMYAATHEVPCFPVFWSAGATSQLWTSQANMTVGTWETSYYDFTDLRSSTIATPGDLVFKFPEFPKTSYPENVVIYIDNLRYEKIA